MTQHMTAILMFQITLCAAACAFYIEYRLPSSETPHAAATSRVHTAGTTGPFVGDVMRE